MSVEDDRTESSECRTSLQLMHAKMNHTLSEQYITKTPLQCHIQNYLNVHKYTSRKKTSRKILQCHQIHVEKLIQQRLNLNNK